MTPRLVTRDQLAGATHAALGGGRRLDAVERLAGVAARRVVALKGPVNGGLSAVSCKGSPQNPGGEWKERLMTVRHPLPRVVALAAVCRCVASTLRLLVERRVHHPREYVGRWLRFADGTQGRVYRETVVDRPAPADPCVLVVAFRLRGVRGRGHVVFQWESWLNTPLFVGFPGFVSKLWLAHDDGGTYRGLYEWDGAESAEAYARALWRVLELVSVKGSIHYQVVPDMRRDELLRAPHVLDRFQPADQGTWWRVAGAS